tara:strand:+ start:156232 stop:156492 length:261 start_codon:yes stop_codon:yes gene_type:complete
MNRNISLTIENLTDEEILKEFTKRFECDGAVLLYMENNVEYGFGRWQSKSGQIWVKQLFKAIKSTPIPCLQVKKRHKVQKIKDLIH